MVFAIVQVNCSRAKSRQVVVLKHLYLSYLFRPRYNSVLGLGDGFREEVGNLCRILSASVTA
jgi:hypothetical protein